MNRKMGLPMMVAAVLVGIVLHALAQTGTRRQPPWLEPRNPNRLEWLVLEKQANEGINDFGEMGVTVNFYIDRDSNRIGEILCDLTYLPSTSAETVQQIEDGILKRFEMQRRVDPWARVKIIKKVVKPN